MKRFISGIAALAAASMPLAALADTRVSGQGMIYDGRTFAVSATINGDGTASGHATLINRTFAGDLRNGPFRDHIEITCGYRAGNTVVLGGYSSNNDSNLTDEAVVFTIQDNGNPGKNRDIASGANYFDDLPGTTGVADASYCLNTGTGDFGGSTILRGNFTIRDSK